MVTQLGEVIEIFNLKTGEHRVYYGPGGEPVFSILASEAMPKGIKGFNDVVVSDSCIYAIFDGILFKDRISAYRSGKNSLRVENISMYLAWTVNSRNGLILLIQPLVCLYLEEVC